MGQYGSLAYGRVGKGAERGTPGLVRPGTNNEGWHGELRTIIAKGRGRAGWDNDRPMLSLSFRDHLPDSPTAYSLRLSYSSPPTCIRTAVESSQQVRSDLIPAALLPSHLGVELSVGHTKLLKQGVSALDA